MKTYTFQTKIPNDDSAVYCPAWKSTLSSWGPISSIVFKYHPSWPASAPPPLGIHSLSVALIRAVLYDRGMKQSNHVHSSNGLPLGMFCLCILFVIYFDNAGVYHLSLSLSFITALKFVSFLVCVHLCFRHLNMLLHFLTIHIIYVLVYHVARRWPKHKPPA